MADVSSTLRAWSSTPGSNQPTGSTNIGAGLDDNLREIQAVTRKFLASKGTAIASAATMDLTTMDAYYASVTGNTTVTGLGTEAAGISYYLRTASTPMFKHGAAAIVLPSAADITAAAGDVFRFTSEGSGVWVLTGFQSGFTGSGLDVRAVAPTLSGANLGSSTVATTQAAADNSTKVATTAYVDRGAASALVLITSTTATNAASVAFTSGFSASLYTGYLITFSNIVPQTDNADLYFTASIDAGSNYLTSYDLFNTYVLNNAGGTGTVDGVGSSVITIGVSLGNATGETWSGALYLQDPGNAVVYKNLHGTYAARRSDARTLHGIIGATIPTASAVTAVKAAMSSGNINGTINFYGIRKT